MKIILTFLFSFVLLSAQLKIAEAFPNLTFTQPVEIVSSNDESNRLFVLSQPGKIYSFAVNQNVQSANLFLDIESSILSGGEQGLLGLAFHPNFRTNRTFFVYYTKANPRRSVISKYLVSSSNPNLADVNSETVLMEIEQPYSNHNGGKIAFGSDGYLYISLGDGGSGGDPQNNGQNISTALGSILRIDIDNKDAGKEYSIPSDNPFINNSTAAKEIYAYGLRNVWKFNFDYETNLLWAADVGQNEYEEINLIENGKNYGWRLMEGFHCYNPSNCNQTGLSLPIHEYGHNDSGGYSVTGGHVYRGIEASELVGKYIYGDFISGNIWALVYSNNTVLSNQLIFETNYTISTFGEDENRNLYFADYNSGKIYKITGSPVTSITENLSPNKIELYQNYPNPFNPKTSIEYSVPSNEFVLLSIFDVLGREIIRLVEEQKSAGKHKVNFDAGDLSSGIYYYQLKIGGYSETKKLLLLK